MKRLACAFIVVAGIISASTSALADGAKRPFTVADDIGYTHFIPDGYSGGYERSEGIIFSPNGEFFAVLTARGRLDLDQVEESLRFYRSQDVETFLKDSDAAQPSSPVWFVNRLAKKEPIADFRWLADSSGVAFLEHADHGDCRIVLADLRRKAVEVLPGNVAQGDGFDISDRNHYIYVAVDDAARKEVAAKKEAEQRAPMNAFTGDVWDLLNDPAVADRVPSDRKHLWLVHGRDRTEIKHDGTPLAIADIESRTLALSPDGRFLVTKQRVKIPQEWERLYPPPYASDKDRLEAGKSTMQYVRIDLKTGSATPLTDAPESSDAGWWSGDGAPSWSSDGRAILLPGTFIKSKDNTPTRPCMAVFDVPSNTATCVEKLKGRINEREFEEGYHHFMSARFAAGDSDVVLGFFDLKERNGTVMYRRASDGTWQRVSRSDGFRAVGPDGLEISIKQGLDQPPLLVASNGKASSTIWDPNPQFKDLDLGQVKVYSWKDSEGRDWSGGLYLPAGHQTGQRYPLVIQTHGFSDTWFTPSGSFPTAFAARELVARGIAVLQVGGVAQCGDLRADEAACEAEGFAAGVKRLVSDGIVDPQNVGYIGFSRSCWYGMEMLTDGSFPLKAALLADGIQASYFEFNLFGIDFDREIDASPFGPGLQEWVKRSPGFHLDKVNAPVLIATEREAIEMWQPFSGLRYLKKPVELVRVNTDEHVITNPVERMASQGLSVDWFRFWLQNYEDPDPAKAEQYKRWRELKKMQAENEKQRLTPQAALH